MEEQPRKFWPFKVKATIIPAMLVFVVLIMIIIILILKKDYSSLSINTVLIGILILSLLPLLLVLLDVIIERGGSIGYKDFKLDFSKVTPSTPSGIVIPPNIGGPGVAVNESSILMILEALKKAGESSIVIVDIEDGKAWWETRLLLLIEGAARLGKPDKIVFTGKVLQQEQYFLGWAEPSVLLPLLLNSNDIYNKLYYNSITSARQWAFVEPPPMPNAFPIIPPYMTGSSAINYGNIAFKNGLPNEFLTEQILGNALGNQIEQKNPNLYITRGKIIDLFGDVLVKDQVDESWAAEQQLKAFFDHDSAYLALTHNGKYLKLVPRLSIINEILRKNMGIHNKKKEQA